ncbi:MAG: glutamine synthetase III [Pseudomonadota bacterium]
MQNYDNVRNTAVETVLNRKPLVMENKPKNITDIFGEFVLSYSKLKGTLPGKSYNDLMETILNGKRLSKSTAVDVANSAKDWALSMGVTHYTHWFQPQTDLSAEKHDALFTLDENNNPITKLSASQLIQSEPDASSFPSGGRRSTFEARGYAAWDPTSPMFIVETPNGKTLCIPSMFLSYNGEALDLKTPLIRSNIVVEKEILKLLRMLGDNNTKHVNVTVGAEQEYFLVDKSFYTSREDLLFCGRTLIGGWFPKGQELEDHYFGSIQPRVMAFMQEFEYELFRLGVPCKTRHNEVAPAQYEFAPLFEEANVAADHNQLVMETIRKISDKHGFAVLFHEKPFSRINGSGKHLNWSVSTSDGINLLEPSESPQQNYKFLLMMLSVLKGVCEHGGAVRASIATHSNDHRLGANEAPPAIISVFIGKRLQDLFESIQKSVEEKKTSSELRSKIELAYLPGIKLDDCDRNRTSPFAFTGNKFEFRSAGSSQAISYPLTIVNAAVADGIAYVNSKLEAELSKNKDVETAVFATIKTVLPEVKKILFDGNNYSDEWEKEAEKRGLPILNNTPAAYKWFKDNGKFLVDNKIYTTEEFDAKIHIMLERYSKAILIEAGCLIDMIKVAVIPSAEEELELRNGGTYRKNNTKLLSDTTLELCQKVEELEVLHKKAKQIENPAELSELLAYKMLPLFDNIHVLSNLVEQNTRDYLWRLPKYREMLFLR